jgi:peptide chain release factor subunit 1
MSHVSPPGGENGFNQAIELSADTLANVKFVQEKRLISKFFDEIAQDTGRYIFGVADTLACLEMGAVETLMVYEALDVVRYTVMNSVSGESEVKMMTPAQASSAGAFRDEATGAELEVQESTPLLEWLAENYKKFGCALEFVTNKSQEGSQFCRGFGGIGGLLRYAVDPAQFEAALDDLDNGPVWDSDEDI